MVAEASSVESLTPRPPYLGGRTLVAVSRKGPLLRPSRAALPTLGTFGLDLTAGCGLDCPTCYIRGLPTYPGDGRVLFDPETADRLVETLESLERPPGLVVLSPHGDPLPEHRAIREEATRVVRVLLDRGIGVAILTRGWISRSLVADLSEHPDLARVDVALTTLTKSLSRVMEPRASPPAARLRALSRLTAAGVVAEVRLEPLIPGLTDTATNLKPLFAGLARAGVGRVVAHYLFQHPAMIEPTAEALAPLGMAQRLADTFQGGPVFPLGNLKPLKHLPLEARREGFARLAAWGAEAGLVVETGAAQNPDMPRERRGLSAS